MAEQRVTDDVLDHWASEAKKEPPGKLGSINLPAVVGMLIAELRASRPREAEAKARIVEVDAALRQMAQAFHRVLAKWDVLQQRIDKALAITYASDDGTEYSHSHRRGEGEPDCPACWAHDVRTALTGSRWVRLKRWAA